MIDEGKYRFRTFTMEIKKRPMVPNSYLVIFSGGQDVKFMWNPYEAPSNKKGEYVLKIANEDRLTKFESWLNGQVSQYGGIKE
jgi:hypothetical protein